MTRWLSNAVRLFPKTSLACVTLVVLGGAAAAGYGYAAHQWRLAERAIQSHQWAEAERPLQLCLKVWPRNVRLHLWAARAARSTGNFPRAESLLNHCLRLNGQTSRDIQLEFLLMRAQTGEVDEVAPALLDLVENDHPDSSLILETLARAYLFNLRYRPALLMLDRWIEASPDTALPHDLRGWLLERVNNATEALKSYHRALELDPGLIDVRLKIAEILLGKSSAPEALPHLEMLYERASDRPAVLARLGQCRAALGEADEARRLMEKALPDMPKDAPLLIALARLELDEGAAAAAEKYLRRVLAADPADVEARYILVSSLQIQNRNQEAADELDRYQTLRKDLEHVNLTLKKEAEQPTTDPAVAHGLGMSLMRIGHERLALHWLHEALERAPDYPPTHQALAEHYERTGDTEKAASHRRRVVQSTPR